MRAAVTLIVAAFALVGACGGEANPPSESGELTTSPPPASPSEGEEVLVRGIVQTGVEPGCLLLITPGREYLLLDAPQVEVGKRYLVRGKLRPGAATTCMQGTPMTVLRADPL
ncbi:hypothetical protein FHU38_004119 [Saccharomonospora amisosensis]|uniref:Lipoprotein n=1 Tax=Saccharomonospora amisosensis TaxID=1128677 RepID=A0A7X5UTA1_9PSEU|nr:hypothetical protein [Saccharomonospora amisosensis]NIJ13775.1 hypothetical protein [Saccharomonospora amisosensis]